ncbi:95916398-f68b-4ade-bb97-78635ff7e679-CDS [Sclerotinia trifoliorum]|uniref:95916398-f68b-4ade-bb97-78635ff7e679-CDS n=1 Tax=Sclerotinia trifoliorum TaxID=28548 RepID=A0A8H2VWL5_9HELO|nr:95916398-f68b-4ade-bb97-78635ff7e679-CDS [Sclerotinia trifoliorum]
MSARKIHWYPDCTSRSQHGRTCEVQDGNYRHAAYNLTVICSEILEHSHGFGGHVAITTFNILAGIDTTSGYPCYPSTTQLLIVLTAVASKFDIPNRRRAFSGENRSPDGVGKDDTDLLTSGLHVHNMRKLSHASYFYYAAALIFSQNGRSWGSKGSLPN